nr:indolepyruvate ferredoxin oxidoreductase family protein [Conexibacter sp. DBS9H8]
MRSAVTLDDKYTAEEGTILLNGIHALVRVLLDLRRLDRRAGLNTSAFISGYQGSPLGGLDRELSRNRSRLEAANTLFQPGLNEELAATAVAGTQLLDDLPEGTKTMDAVTGFWFGKAPGLDRAADAIRHANLSGTTPLGGAVAIIGDDPTSKSSTVPSSSEPLCMSLAVPLLVPSSVGEIISFGLHAVALSRHSGLWAGLKIVADIADASSTVDITGHLDLIPEFPPREGHRAPKLLPPTNLDAELDQITTRLGRASEYARAAKLNLAINEVARPRLAIVAAGMAYEAVVRALWDLGIDEELTSLGIRLVKLGMPWPLDAETVRELVGDAERILVVEDKRPFLETLIRDGLYGQPHTPPVIGKTLEDGSELLPYRSSVSADDITRALPRLLDDLETHRSVADQRERVHGRHAALAGVEALASRTPYFCSGCPHNVSTRADEDQLVGAGIGCHTMVVLDEPGRRGHILGMTQMGGEGMQWLGLAPFTTEDHFFQNIGDGTFHHSGSLAIRAATAAKAHMTFKLLYNDAVAMTGGQNPEGRLPIPQLTRWMALEGVSRVIITTPEPETYEHVTLDPIASVRHRDDLPDVHRELAATPGVTVLIHDDRCATEKRRLRKRGKLPAATQRVWINERVCEGCGDCGEQSSCLSVLPVHTEFGRKTQIHQPSCNSDMTCLKGDCPSFLLIEPAAATAAHQQHFPEPPPSPTPTLRVPNEVLIRMPGIGGTGVVTASAILQMAAHLDGRHAEGLEQIGLAQKGGPVISDIRISDRAIPGQIKASTSSIDVLLGLDLLGATSVDTLKACEPSLTIAVLNLAEVPTSQMVIDTHVGFPERSIAVRRVEAATRRDELLTIDAEGLSERLFGDHMPANVMLLGAAFQHGCIPVSEEALERAIELNGAAVTTTLAAFRWGRTWASNPDAVQAVIAETSIETPPLTASAAALAAATAHGLTGTAATTTALRLDELTAFQDSQTASRYLDEVVRVAQIEDRAFPGHGTRLTEAYARNLYKLIAYKDEYEVARLHLSQLEQHKREALFGPDAQAKVLLHPPLLRSLGMERKLAIPAGVATPLFRSLVRLRRLRGTPLDIFARAEVRQVERRLPGEYSQLVSRALALASSADYEALVSLAELPDMVRGYEQIKLDNVERFRSAGRAALAAIGTDTARPREREIHLSSHSEG